MLKDDSEKVKQNEHEYDYITYNSFIKLGNYFSKIMSEYIHAVNTTNCWICAAFPKSTNTDILYHHIPLSYAVSCAVIISVADEVLPFGKRSQI